MTLGLEHVRLAAALAHSSPDADLELRGWGRRWLVSHRRADATIDPCGFRQLVLAAMRGCRVPVLPVETVCFLGALRELGGGIYEHDGPEGIERRVATFLPATRVEALLRASAVDPRDELVAHVSGDEELGVTVVSIGGRLVVQGRVDEAARWLASTCLVEELVWLVRREVAP